MRRFAAVLSLALLAAAALSGTALAKEGGVELSSTPTGKGPGEPWQPSLTLLDGTPELLAVAKPGVTITNTDTGVERTFAAKPTENPHVYSVRVVFPDPGWWTVEAFDGVTGRSYSIGGQYFIHGPESEPPVPGGAARVSDDSFPVWPVTGGSIAFFLAAVGATLLFRRQRFGLSH